MAIDWQSWTTKPMGYGMTIPGIVGEASRKKGLPHEMLAKLIQAESGGNPNAVSPVGAQGAAQIMPGTQKELGITDPFDPYQSIMGGAEYLKQQKDRFGEWDSALAAYNAGPGAVEKYGGVPPFPETQNYVQKITGQGGAEEMKPQTQQLQVPDFLMQQLQNDLKPQGTGSKIGTILGGLGEVAASFHSPQAQQQYRATQLAREESKQAQRKSALGGLLDVYKVQQSKAMDPIEMALINMVLGNGQGQAQPPGGEGQVLNWEDIV